MDVSTTLFVLVKLECDGLAEVRLISFSGGLEQSLEAFIFKALRWGGVRPGGGWGQTRPIIDRLEGERGIRLRGRDIGGSRRDGDVWNTKIHDKKALP